MSEESKFAEQLKQLQDEIKRLEKVNLALMNRVEHSTDAAGSAYSLFESNLLLQNKLNEHAGKLVETNHALQLEVKHRKQIADELKRERDFISAILDTAGGLVVVLDTGGRIIRFNQKCQEITGYTFNEVNAKPFWEIFLIPEEMDRIREVFEELRSGNFPNEAENYWKTKRGDLRRISWSNTAITDDENNVEYIIATGLDVTERKKAEEELRWERNFVNAVLDTAGALIVVMNRKGDIIRFNRACERISGYSFEEVQNKPFWDILLLPEEIQPVRERFSRLFEGEFPNYGENYWVTKSGERRLVSWSNTALRDAQGEVEYVVAIGIDITESRQAEEKLKLYRLIFLTSSDAITIADKDGNVMERNPAHEQLLGYSDQETIGKPTSIFLDVRDAQRIGKSLESSKAFRGEVKALDKAGTSHFMDVSIFPIYSEAAELICYVGMGKDISQRKKDQEAIATRLRYEEGLAGCARTLLEMGNQSEVIPTAIRHLLNAARVGRVYIFENFEDPNDGLCARQRYEVSAPGVASDSDNPYVQHLPYSDALGNWHKSVSENKPFRGLTKNLSPQMQGILQQGGVLSILILPLWVNKEWYGFIGFDEVNEEREWSDEEIRLLRTAADIIGGYLSRQRAYEALRVSEERFRSLVENANDVIYSLNEKGDINYLSPKFEDYTGYKLEVYIGKPVVEMVYEEDVPNIKEWISTGAITEDRRTGYEWRLRDLNGDLRWFVSNSSVMRNEDGSIREIIGVAHDITEIKRLVDDLEKTNQDLRDTQTKLVQSEKMASLGMLVAGIAHEINTPMGAVGSMHNTLMRATARLNKTMSEEWSDDNPVCMKVKPILQVIDEANKVIKSGTDRVTTIVRRLRSFARLDEAELSEADIHECMEDTLTLVHHEIKHHIKVNRNYGDIPQISCFPGRLNQVFINLLVNAKQAIKDQGEITITTYEKAKRIYIEISDTGTGIPEQNLPKIFDPGFTTKGVGVGTGLGLSICYQIIQDHRGEIKVHSEVGKGTTFTIILPENLDEILGSNQAI